MKIVRLSSYNTVMETIPDYALPVEDWYGKAFAEQCREAPDEVMDNWVFDPEKNTFSPPPPPPPPEPDERTLLKAQVQAQADREEFLEDCIAEMAMELYG